MRTKASMNYTVNGLRYEINFGNCVKDKKNFFMQRKIAFLEQKYFILGNIFFKIPKNLITSAFFTKTDMHRYVSAKVSNAALVKLTN